MIKSKWGTLGKYIWTYWFLIISASSSRRRGATQRQRVISPESYSKLINSNDKRFCPYERSLSKSEEEEGEEVSACYLPPCCIMLVTFIPLFTYCKIWAPVACNNQVSSCSHSRLAVSKNPNERQTMLLWYGAGWKKASQIWSNRRKQVLCSVNIATLLLWVFRY